MFDLSKFKPYDFIPGVTAVTVTKHGAGFSKKVIAVLNQPKFIRVAINSEAKQLALFPAAETENGVIKCTLTKSGQFRILHKGFLHDLAALFNITIEKLNLKAIGHFYPEHTVIVFNLKMESEDTA